MTISLYQRGRYDITDEMKLTINFINTILYMHHILYML